MHTRPLVLAALLALVTAAPAAAHVDVLPTRVQQGEAVALTVRVPTERDVATIRVRVDFPPEFTVYSFGPPPQGWRTVPRRAPDGRIVGVVWQGGRIPPEGYADFTLLATPFDAGTTRWTSIQTYADGVRKPWTGPVEKSGEATPETGPESPGAAAGVEVVPAGTPVTELTPAAASTGDSDAGLWAGLIAIVIALIALGWTTHLWTTRPVALPVDDDATDTQGP